GCGEPRGLPQLDATVDEARDPTPGRVPEHIFTAPIGADRAEVERQDSLARLECEVLALDAGAKHELVSQMRALMVETQPSGEAIETEGNRQADHVVGVDEVVRGGVEI